LALELIYPADKTVVVRSNFLIIKGGEKPALDALVVEVNGVASDPLDISTEDYKAAFADFLILEPEWSKGMNAISVKGFVAGKVVATTKADIFFSPLADPLPIIPAGYNPFVMHTAEKEALCAPCHNMQPSADQLRGMTADDNPCGSCHQRMLNRDFVHGPEGVFQCVDCHDSKDGGSRWRVTKTELTLCGEYHSDKIDEFKKNTFLHGPVASGSCIVCHDPHASDESAQLNAPINLLCAGCHSAVDQKKHVLSSVKGSGHPLSKVKNPLQTGRQMSCVSCHNPHSGAGEMFFINGKTSRFGLCQECHKK
jgi:predicted CXXCH cytochrome family protein